MRVLLRIIKSIRTTYCTTLAKWTLGDNGDIKANRLTILTKRTKVGRNVHFNGMRVVGKGEVYFGNNFHSGKNCQIITDIHNYHGSKLPYDEKIISKNVIIHDNVWLGNNVIILGGVEIGEGAIIQAGSVVVKNIDTLAIAGGHPAMQFSMRDAEHYFRLKENKMFF
ncbi:acyltransferase [Ulvibacterium sp.]|uniref:acyltransferase n=1 Tax=Ulvibacterium sp. TaxID=2665914 RepID=UPI003CC5D7C1